MDTRRKILTPPQALEAAQSLRAAGTRIHLVSGYFDVLQASLIRQLNEAATPQARLFALVLLPPTPLLTAQARAELAAALRVIDYVIDSSSEPVDFIASLRPDLHIRAQEAHLAAREHLIRHVLERHGRNPESSPAGRPSH